MNISGYEMEFEGEVLQRGFWLYVWEIIYRERTYIYVGRTGDSSSPNASSPFNRIGQHLDFRANAKGNSLAKHLRERGVEPRKSKFRMLALGPLFEEKESFDKHKPLRDQMATFEYEIAEHLRNLNYDVLGTHHKGTHASQEILGELRLRVSQFLKYIG